MFGDGTRTTSPITLDDDSDVEEGSSACPIVIPDSWDGRRIMLPPMDGQPPRSTSPIIIPESWMGRPLLLPVRPGRRRAGRATAARRSQPEPRVNGAGSAAAAQRGWSDSAPPAAAAAAAAASPLSDTVRGGRRGRGRGARRDRGGRSQSAGPGRGRGRAARAGHRGAAATAARGTPGPSRDLLDKVNNLMAGIIAGTEVLRQGQETGPNLDEPTAGPSGIQTGFLDGEDRADPAGDGDVTFGVLRCSAVGVHYYPGQLTGSGEPVRLLLTPSGAGWARRDVRVVNALGLTSAHLSREFAGVLAPHLEANRVRLEGVCVDRDHSTATLDVTARGRERHRRQVCDQLRKMGFELEDPSGQSSPVWTSQSSLPTDMFTPVKPSCTVRQPERTLVTPRDPRQALNECWAAAQQSLKEVEPCAAVASQLYRHQKQALGWMQARETSGAVAEGPDAVCGGILADDMGLGKTLQVIALILTHFKAGMPLAVPVPSRQRVAPRAPAPPSPPPPLKKKIKTSPLGTKLSSPKFDWSTFRTKLSQACRSPSVKTEGASGSNGAQRRPQTKRKPSRHIDSTDDEEEEEEPAGWKRRKSEPTDAGPSTGLTAPSADSTHMSLLSDSDDSTELDGGAGADRTRATAAASGRNGSGESIPALPSYCDADGRSQWPGPRTTLIVCPLSVLDNWETQLEQHVHKQVHLRVRLYHGPRRQAVDLVNADVVLTTYATLGRELDRADDSPLLRNHFLRVVLDEGHTIRNPRSVMARAAYELRAQRRWVLTGTPVQNRLKDLWSLLHFLRLEPYASQHSLWSVAIEQPVMRGNAEAVERLQTLMLSLALRRLKDQRVDGKPIVELPPRNMFIQHVTMEGEQRRRYDTMEEQCRSGMARFIRDGTIVRRQVQILVMLLRLRQLCLHPQLVPDHEQPLPSEGEEGAAPSANSISTEERQRLVAALAEMLSSGSDEECSVCLEPMRKPVITICSHVFCRPCVGRLLEPARAADGAHCPLCRGPLRADQLVEVTEEELRATQTQKDATADDPPPDDTVSAKVTALMEGLRAMRTEDITTKALVVSQFTGLLDRLEAPLRAAGLTFCRLDGSMTLAVRRRAMARFASTERDAPCVMLLSLRAGGEGINLTAASHVFLLDPAWNPASEEQCFDRCHRLGQTRPVTIVKLVTQDSVEERMLALQEKKRQLMTSAFSGAGLTTEQRRVQFINDMRTLFNM